MAEKPIFTLGPQDFMSGIRTGDFTGTKNGLFSADRHVASALYRPDLYQGLLRPPNGIYSLSNDGLKSNVVASTIYTDGFDTLLYQVDFDGHLYESNTELITTAKYELAFATPHKSLDLSTNSLNVSGTLKGMEFNGDGSKLYVLTASNSIVHELDLSTKYDIETASDAGSDLDTGTETPNPTGMAFNGDGTKLFLADSSNDVVQEYDLSTAYDVSTASTSGSFDISTQSAEVDAIIFNGDGTKMYIADNPSGGADIYSYSLSTAYDVTTASSTNSLDVNSVASGPRGIAFNNDGSRLFIAGSDSENIHSYNLSTAYDISTATFKRSFDANEDPGTTTTLEAVTFNGDGSEMYILSGNDYLVYQYQMKHNTDLRADTPIVSGSVPDGQTTVANGLAVYQPKGGDAYLYYMQNTQIGRWDLNGLYPTGWTDDWQTTDIETTIEKPTYQFQDRVYFGNDSYVGFIGDDGNGGVNFNGKALDLPADYHVTSLSDDSRRLVIAATRQQQSGQVSSHAGSKIFFWDTNSSSWNKAWEMKNSTGIVSIRNVNGTIYILEESGLYQCSYNNPPQSVVEFQPDESSNIGPKRLVADASYEQNNIKGVSNHQTMAIHQNGVMWINKSNNLSFYGQYTSEQPDNTLDVMFGSYPNANIISSTTGRGFTVSGTSAYLTDEYDFSKITINSNKSTEWVDLEDRYDITSIEVVFGYELTANDELKINLADTSNTFQKYATIDHATYGNTKRVRVFGKRPKVDSMKLDFEFVDGQPYVQKVLVYGDKVSQ